MSQQPFTTLPAVDSSSNHHHFTAFLASNPSQQAPTGLPLHEPPSLQQPLYHGHTTRHHHQHQNPNSSPRDSHYNTTDHLHTPKSMDGRGLPDCPPSELSPAHAHQQPSYYQYQQNAQQDLKHGIRSPPANRHSAIPPTPTSPQANPDARTPSFVYNQRQQQRPYDPSQRYQQQPPTPSDLASPGAQQLPRSGMASTGSFHPTPHATPEYGGSLATSPIYATHPQQQYSAYQPHSGHEMYQQGGAMPYGARPEWAAASQYGHSIYGHMPVSAAGGAPGMVGQDSITQGHPLSTVYSFVPIPGAQQHKRPRRRFEEIERMYKCGWQGCEKAYGTLNHLNAHVTMQSHGNKRTPEEFKEIRKEWKAKKKEEDNARKVAEEERSRQDQGRNDSAGHHTQAGAQQSQQAQQAPQYTTNGSHSLMPTGTQLPPIGYPQGSAPTSATSSPPYSAATDGSDSRQYASQAGQMYQPGYSYSQYQQHHGQPDNHLYGPP